MFTSARDSNLPLGVRVCSFPVMDRGPVQGVYPAFTLSAGDWLQQMVGTPLWLKVGELTDGRMDGWSPQLS